MNKFRLLKIKNMATELKFEVMSESFQVQGTDNRGPNGQKYVKCIINNV